MNPRTLTLASILSLALWCVAVLIGCSIVWAARNLGQWPLLIIATALGTAALVMSRVGDES